MPFKHKMKPVAVEIEQLRHPTTLFSFPQSTDFNILDETRNTNIQQHEIHAFRWTMKRQSRTFCMGTSA